MTSEKTSSHSSNATRALGIYVAGPLYSSGELMDNVADAVQLGATIEMMADEMGLELYTFVPHIMTFVQPMLGKTHEAAQRWDDHWLRRCDALVYLPGKSVGTAHELTLASRLGIPAFASDDLTRLFAWARTQS